MKIYYIIAIQFMAILLFASCGDQEVGFLKEDQSSAKTFTSPVTKPKIGVSFSLKNPRPTLGEPIIMRLNVSNESDEPLTLYLGVNRRNGYLLEIKKPDSTVAIIGTPPPKPDFGATGEVTVKPWTSFQYDVLVSEWFDPLLPGDYLLSANLANPIALQRSNTTFRSGSTTMPFSVEKKDVSRLRSVSEQLLQTILTNASVDERWFAARSLTQVDDPLVIPFIEEALLSNRVEGVLLDTLEEQGNERAIDTLIGLATAMTDQRSVSIVAFKLKMLERQMKDVRLKEKIKSALLRINSRDT